MPALSYIVADFAYPVDCFAEPGFQGNAGARLVTVVS